MTHADRIFQLLKRTFKDGLDTGYFEMHSDGRCAVIDGDYDLRYLAEEIVKELDKS